MRGAPLSSDDGGHTLRYRQVGYEPDLDTFVPLGDSEAMYVFGHFRPGSPTGHRAYAVHLRWD